jgi:hypothetical protein
MIENKKGQMNGVGMIIVIALAVIVGAILFQASAQNVHTVRNTVAIVNESFAAANNTLYTPISADYKSCANVVIYNNTADVIIGAGNYTVTNNVLVNGAERITVAVNYSSAVYAGDGWNISCTAQPSAYSSSGGRAVTGLIILFFALAVAVIAMYPIYQGGLKNILSR